MNLEKSMEEIAEQIAKRVKQDATPFSEVLDAMKVLNQYYALVLKHKKSPEDDEDEGGFDFTRGIGVAENTNGVRSRGRRPES